MQDSFMDCEAFRTERFELPGKRIRIDSYNWMSYVITERTYIPKHIFSEVTCFYTIDYLIPLQFKENIEQCNGVAIPSNDLYCNENGWFAQFKYPKDVECFIIEQMPKIKQS